MISYEQLYGCNLDEYCEHHGFTIDFLIKKTEKDIELLKKSYDRLAQRNHLLTDDELFLAMSIRELINKKKKHLDRLKSWSSS